MAGARCLGPAIADLDPDRWTTSTISERMGSQVIVFGCDAELDALASLSDRALHVPDPDNVGSILDDMDSLVLEALNRAGLDGGNVFVSTVLVNPSGVLSTSYDQDAMTRVGLHIDDHECLDLVDRGRATPVCCLNIGEGDRVFGFVPQTVRGLLDKVPDFPISGGSGELTEAIFAQYPDAPILQLTLRPGQGYVAIAQNLIHDAAGPTSHKDVAYLSLRSVSRLL